MRPALIDLLAPWIGRDLAQILAPSWFTFIALSALVTSVLLVRAARRAGEDVPTVLHALTLGYLAAVATGVLVPLLADVLAQALRGDPVRVRWAGMTSFWGFAGGFLAVALVIRRSGRISLARFGDLAAAPLGMAVVVARLGCLLAGCDYGQVSGLPWAVRFPRGSGAFADHVRSGLVPSWRGESLPVHPTQAYEALLGLAMFLWARWAARRPWARERAGRVFLSTAALYGVGRALIENLRGDAGRGLFGPFSSGQIFSFLLLAAIGWAVWRSRRAALPVVATLAVLVGAAGTSRAEQFSLQVDGTLGTATPLNRRANQVPQLGGAALSGSVLIEPRLALGLELDSMGNTVATHSAALLTFGMRWPLAGPRLEGTWRFGLGVTDVDFRDGSFDDVLASTLRLGAGVDYALTPTWRLIARPLGFDLTSAASIGGPILTYQFQIGIAYRHELAPAPRPAPPAESAPPEPTPTPSGPPGATTTRADLDERGPRPALRR